MSRDFVNDYTPTVAQEPTLPESEFYGPTPYDINFAYPLYEETLQTPRLKIVPFIPSIHAETYWAHVGNRPELFRFYPFLPGTLPEFLTWLELNQRRNPHQTFFALIDLTRPDPAHPTWGGSLAGAVALCNAAPANLGTEIGYVVVFPEFHHTHVAKEMVGLLLRYLLQLPRASPPGLGLRRVEWRAHPGNAPSIGLAERMGFKRDGLLRWLWVLPDVLTHMGDKGRVEDPADGRSGRHTVVLSVCWDDWEGGVKDKVEALLSK